MSLRPKSVRRPRASTAKNSKVKNPWVTLNRESVYENPWIRISERKVINPSGRQQLYGVVEFQNVAVGVIAVDAKGRLILVGQYRYATDGYSWEIPEGGSPLGTKELTSAKRELKEETGYRARLWTHFLTLHLSNSSTDERAEVYLASGLTEGESEPEDTEQLMMKHVTLEEALKMIERGEITDAISVAALYKYAHLPKSARAKLAKTRA